MAVGRTPHMRMIFQAGYGYVMGSVMKMVAPENTIRILICGEKPSDVVCITMLSM
jgi:predicted phage tail protein